MDKKLIFFGMLPTMLIGLIAVFLTSGERADILTYSAESLGAEDLIRALEIVVSIIYFFSVLMLMSSILGIAANISGHKKIEIATRYSSLLLLTLTIFPIVNLLLLSLLFAPTSIPDPSFRLAASVVISFAIISFLISVMGISEKYYHIMKPSIN